MAIKAKTLKGIKKAVSALKKRKKPAFSGKTRKASLFASRGKLSPFAARR